MGCTSSRVAAHDETKLNTGVSAPAGASAMVSPTYRDKRGPLHLQQGLDIDRETLIQALNEMASSFEQQKVSALVISVGGAVDTLQFKSRKTANDFGFFLTIPSATDHQAVSDAAQLANAQMGGVLGEQWFKNATPLFMNQADQRDLADEAIAQDVVIFDRIGQNGGLRLYAAPWPYAFCGKLDWICDTARRPYDLADSVAYLRQYLSKHHLRSVGVSIIYGWCKQFKNPVTEAVLREIDEAFYQQHGRRPINWKS